jgi:hypothetical protein
MSLVNCSSYYFITTFSTKFSHIQSSLGCVDNDDEQQWVPLFVELDVICIAWDDPSVLHELAQRGEVTLREVTNMSDYHFSHLIFIFVKMDTGYIQLTLGKLWYAYNPCVEPVTFLLFWHPLSLNVTWLDAPESAIHMSLLFNMVMDVIMVLVPSPYSLSC